MTCTTGEGFVPAQYKAYRRINPEEYHTAVKAAGD
jgi:hypothetical protein